MNQVISLVLTLGSLACVIANASADDRCGGAIALSDQACGNTLTIGGRVVGKCLSKTSAVFAPLMKACNDSQYKYIETHSGRNSDLDNCDGPLSIDKSSCGYNFSVETIARYDDENGSRDPFQMTCKGEDDSTVKAIRNYCNANLAGSANTAPAQKTSGKGF
jgi:hypothetical protein